MTLFQALLFLALFIAALLASYILAMLLQWRREDEPDDGRWEVGCCIRTAHDPHGFLPGVWRISTHYNDGTSEWTRIA